MRRDQEKSPRPRPPICWPPALRPGGTWTGIDNSTGNAWTEEFGTQAECLKWLKGENAVFTLDEAVSRIYELSAEAHMNMARNLKERRTWCEKNLKNYQTIKRAFE